MKKVSKLDHNFKFIKPLVHCDIENHKLYYQNIIPSYSASGPLELFFPTVTLFSSILLSLRVREKQHDSVH